MWQPEPGWQLLPGAGPATDGVWSATIGGRDVVVKRLRCPEPIDAPGAMVPADVNYWRRAADVDLTGVVAASPGLREAPVVRVDEDDEGITLVHARVEHGGVASQVAHDVALRAGRPEEALPPARRAGLRSVR